MDHNYCVIISGGIGSRFWPKSTADHPKQFQDVTGVGQSLLQQTYRRMLGITSSDKIYVLTHKDYVQKVADQIDVPRENILPEPVRRNTAPCIAYACIKIYQRDPKASVFVAPSDHFIAPEEKFISEVQSALDYVARYPSLLTFGIRPTHPSTGYGYIRFGDAVSESLHRVVNFTEKPPADLAQKFLLQGDYLWNSGMFAWSAKTLLEEVASFLPELYDVLNEGLSDINTPREQAYIDDHFHRCPNISIDHGVMEKSSKIVVKPADFTWSDIGTWNSVYDISPKKNLENVCNVPANFYRAHRNIISLNDQKKIAVIQGLDDFIVAESQEALLICHRDQEQEVKSFLKDITQGR